MGFWTAAKALFTAPKATETGLDLLQKGASGIDMVFYTDEEKEIARKEWFSMVLDVEKQHLEQGLSRSQTRRELARDFSRTYIFLALVAVALYKVDPGWVKFILQVMELLSYAVVPIVVFHFGSYGWGAYVKKEGK